MGRYINYTSPEIAVHSEGGLKPNISHRVDVHKNVPLDPFYSLLATCLHLYLAALLDCYIRGQEEWAELPKKYDRSALFHFADTEQNRLLWREKQPGTCDKQLSASTELSDCFTSILILQASLPVVQIQLLGIGIFLYTNAFLKHSKVSSETRTICTFLI